MNEIKSITLLNESKFFKNTTRKIHETCENDV